MSERRVNYRFVTKHSFESIRLFRFAITLFFFHFRTILFGLILVLFCVASLLLRSFFASCFALCFALCFCFEQACVERVTSKGFGTCEPWFFDYVKCVDKCVSTPDEWQQEPRGSQLLGRGRFGVM